MTTATIPTRDQFRELENPDLITRQELQACTTWSDQDLAQAIGLGVLPSSRVIRKGDHGHVRSSVMVWSRTQIRERHATLARFTQDLSAVV
jgi:hypothetical protein